MICPSDREALSAALDANAELTKRIDALAAERDALYEAARVCGDALDKRGLEISDLIDANKAISAKCDELRRMLNAKPGGGEVTKDARERVSDDLRATMVGIDRMAHLVDQSIAEKSREAIRIVLGLLTDVSERNRKLGAAIRAVLAEWDVPTIHGVPEWDTLPSVQWEVLHAIAKALRAEAGDE